jgi:hypothetical protein
VPGFAGAFGGLDRGDLRRPAGGQFRTAPKGCPHLITAPARNPKDRHDYPAAPHPRPRPGADHRPGPRRRNAPGRRRLGARRTRDHLAEPLAQRRALAAARRLWDVIAPTQGHRAAASQTGLIFAPDGRYEHIPLRLAAISPGDPAILADAVAVFAGPDASDHVLQALEHGAEVAYGNDSDQACARLLAATGRLAGLLGLPADQDSEQLAALITTDPGRDIVLSVGAEAAYRRYAIRVNQIWRAGDPLHLWQY